MSLIDSIKQAKEQSKKRKFNQSVDLIINLKNIDLKKPENRIISEFLLPGGRGKDVKIAVIADSIATQAKPHCELVIRRDEISKFASRKKEFKKIAKEYDWFLAEAPLMIEIGKTLGTVLGPRGKMPKPVPPKIEIEPFIMRTRNTVRVILRDTPVIQVCIGAENMDDGKIAANATAVLGFVKEKLPKGRNNIRSTLIKLTMGKPVKLEV
jgi:large subunit ribosomal protein L1